MKEKQVIGYWIIYDRHKCCESCGKPADRPKTLAGWHGNGIRFKEEQDAIAALKDFREDKEIINALRPHEEKTYSCGEKYYVTSKEWEQARWEIIPVEKEIA